MRVTRVLAGVVGVLCLSLTGSLFAAPPHPGHPAERLAREFPRMARALAVPVARVDAIRASQPKRFDEPVVLDGRSERVVLRALDAAPVAPRVAGHGASYARAFRGADVLRANGYETLLVDDRGALDAIAYNVADMDGVSMVVPFGRAMRFISATPGAPRADLTLSAPLVVGADGRASYNARWVIANGGTRMATLRIKVDDPLVRYPAAISWAAVTAGAVQTTLTRVPPREVVTSGTGSISGTVTDAATSSPLFGVTVDVYYDFGGYFDAAYTDENGHYTMAGLDSGSYRAVINYGGYQQQMYDGISCGPCDPTQGTAIAVTDGQQTSGIDFALARVISAAISGTVTDSNNSPLGSVGVAIYDASGAAVAYGESNETGAYRAELSGGGTYYARTLNNTYTGYVDQLWSGIDCTACDVTTGTPITVANDETAGGIDFSLKQGGQIAGTVTDAGSGAPLLEASVLLYNSAGRLATFGYTDEAGHYVSWHGLAAGDYYAVGRAADHDPEIYSELPCDAAGCDPVTGTAIPVTLGSTVSNVDFTLARISGRITGTVTDEQSGAPLGGVYVYVYDAAGNLVVASESAYEDGTYTIYIAEAGTYYARTFNFVNAGYADELYENIPCTRCDVTTGTAIQVNAGQVTTGINFALSQTGGWITGKILDTNNAAIDGSYVIIYGSDGSTVTYGLPDANGNYTAFNRLDSGTYYAVASADNHDSQLYDGISCANGCNPVDGTPIEVTAGQTTSGVDFFLAGTGCGSLTISPDELPGGHVTDPYSQQLSVSNAAGAVTWSIIDGALPPGLSLNSSTGLISGTLDAVGTFRFVVQAVDSNGCSAAQAYTIEVTGDETTISLSIDPNPGLLGYPVTFTATITPSAAPGTVNFSVDGTYVGTATVVDGIAQLEVTAGLGRHEAFASYSGGGTYSPSVTPTDPPIEFTIQKGQPPIVWNNPADIVYGTALSATQLNARVVINEGEDPNDPSDDATLSGTYVYDPPAGTILDAGTQTLSVTFYPDDTDQWDPATKTVQIVVQKANQTINWSDPAAITYGTPLSSTQLNATVTVVGPAPAGALTYNPDFNTILDAGTHTLTVTAAATNNYNSATANVTQVVNKANQTIHWDNPDPIVYGTPLGASELDATVEVVGPAPAGALVYNPPAGTILNAGTYTLNVSAAETNNYNPASASVTLVVLKATPVFSNLSAPTIVIGTLSTTISGTLSHGSFIPTGNVLITLNGFTQAAVLQPDGSFGATFATGMLTTTLSGYPLSFDYAGDANFNPASASTTMVVTYGIAGGPNPPVAMNAGATIPMRVTLRNAQGVNLSSSQITVTAAGLRGPGGAFYPVSGLFNYTNSQGGAYTFILHTPNTLTSGVYAFEFTVEDDPVTHFVNFTIK